MGSATANETSALFNGASTARVPIDTIADMKTTYVPANGHLLEARVVDLLQRM